MCKYCEEKSYDTPWGYINVSDFEHGEIAFFKKSGDNESYFTLQLRDDAVKIDYCPWCGRKLEVPRSEVAITKDDFGLLLKQVEELEEKINNEHDRVTQLCTVSKAFVDRVRPNVAIVNSDKEIFRQSLRHLSNN